MPQLIRQHPFATYGVIALLLYLVIEAFEFQHDDGGVGAALIISSPFWGFIFWAPHEVLFSLNEGKRLKSN